MNVVIFGVDSSSSVYADNKKNYISVLNKGPIQELYDTTIAAEAEYSVNFSKSQRKLFKPPL